MTSERTRLSGTILDLLCVIAPRLDKHFEPLLHVFIPTALQLCSRTNKLYITRTRNLLDIISSRTSLTCIVPYLRESCEDKSVTQRAAGIDFILQSLHKFNPPDLLKYVESVESSICCTARDKDPGIRSTCRKVFDAYKLLWPERLERYVAYLITIFKR